MKALLKKSLDRKELWRILKFGAVGASGVVVNEGLFILCEELLLASLSQGPRVAISSAIAVGVSILTNFLLNDAWTWRDRRSQDPGAFWRRMARYYLVAGAAGLLQIAVTVGLSLSMGLNEHLANFCGILAGVAINFFVNNLWTFRAEPERDDLQTDLDATSARLPAADRRPTGG